MQNAITEYQLPKGLYDAILAEAVSGYRSGKRHTTVLAALTAEGGA